MRWLPRLAGILSCVLPLQALNWGDITKAPLLVVGQVVTVQIRSSAATAEVEVVRVFNATATSPRPSEHVRMSYVTYNPGPEGRNGPPRAEFNPGNSYVFALLPSGTPDGTAAAWKLIPGSGTVIPVRKEFPAGAPETHDGRTFLLREMANSLANGSTIETFDTAKYLYSHFENLTPELISMMESQIGATPARWIGIASALLSASYQRPSVSELLSKPLPANSTGLDRPDGPLGLLQAVLRKLPVSRETDRQIIERLLADSSIYSPGASEPWTDYADDPVLVEAIRDRLKRDLPNCSWIAGTLIRHGHTALLPDALEHALRLADQPASDRTELSASMLLLRDYGSDEQRGRLADLVLRYRAIDARHSDLLWGFATGSDSMRDVIILAAVIPDDRFGASRGIAVCNLELVTKESFGCNSKTEEGRRAAIDSATAWLRAHGYAR